MIQEQVAAKAGPAVTVVAGATGWVAKAIPILQFVSLTVSVVVGVLTAAWYGVRFYDRWKAKRGG